MGTTCLSHPNHPTPNTLPNLEGSANLSGTPAPRKGGQPSEFRPPNPLEIRPLPARETLPSPPPENADGAAAAIPRLPRPAAPPTTRRYGVAGAARFGSIRMIQRPFSMSLT